MKEQLDRNIKIWKLKRNARKPKTYLEIALEIGLTPDRVYQIVKDIDRKIKDKVVTI